MNPNHSFPSSRNTELGGGFNYCLCSSLFRIVWLDFWDPFTRSFPVISEGYPQKELPSGRTSCTIKKKCPLKICHPKRKVMESVILQGSSGTMLNFWGVTYWNDQKGTTSSANELEMRLKFKPRETNFKDMQNWRKVPRSLGGGFIIDVLIFLLFASIWEKLMTKVRSLQIKSLLCNQTP